MMAQPEFFGKYQFLIIITIIVIIICSVLGKRMADPIGLNFFWLSEFFVFFILEHGSITKLLEKCRIKIDNRW